MSKRILSLVLALVMVLGTFGTVFAAATTPTGNPKVDKLIEIGLVLGYGNDDYKLTQAITRAEVATMVVRALDLEEVAKASAKFTSQFKDMNSANVEWARGHVNVAAGQGIVNGYPEDGTFKPANNVTYAEAAAMLVRVLNGMTAEEVKTAVWPTTYLAKAAQLGIFADVDGIVDYNAPTNREDLFEMVFNTLMAGTDLLIASTVEGIVVENYRTESLAKNEVVVHVMKDQVAKSSADKDSKYYEESDEFKVVITPELAEKGLDVETLLGKAVKVSFDKENKVVGIEKLAGYTYVKGTINDITSKEIEVNDKEYTVSKSESRDAADERLYQVYLNNDDVDFDELYKKDELLAEYANLTVRNGKVLFIDAYDFDDVAPVAKDIDAKDRVAYYDDNQNGEVRTLTVDEDAYVINFVDGEMQLGEYKDISANDVIHWYENAKEVLTVIVRPSEDNKVEGEYEKASAKKASNDTVINIRVDGTDYEALIGEDAVKRTPVYSTLMSGQDFFQLTGDYKAELEPFEDTEVVVLRDMFDNVQLIASETSDGTFYALVLQVLNNEFKLLRADNTSEYYSTNIRDTEFLTYDDETEETEEVKKALFDVGSLVKVTAKGDILTEVVLLGDDAKEVMELTKNLIKLDGKSVEYLTNSTVVFVEIGSKSKAMSVADFLKNYEDPSDDDYDHDNPTFAYIELGKEDRRTGTKTVDVIVVTDTQEKEGSYNKEVVKIDRVYFVGTNKVDLRVKSSGIDGELTTYAVTDSDARKLINDNIGKKFEKGAIVEISLTKTDVPEIKEIVSKIAAVEVATKEVTNKSGNVIFLDGAEYRLAVDADVFGEVVKGKFVAIYPTTGTVITIADVRAKVVGEVIPPVTTGVVTYINAAGTRFEVDGVVYTVNEDTILKENNNTIAIGIDAIKLELVEGDKVTVKDNVITRTSSQAAADLTAAFSAYNTAKAAVVEADYTTASWTTYKAVVDANVVTAQNTITQINTAKTNITVAQADLVEVADLTAYNAAKAAVVEADYTTASWTTYKAVVDASVVTAQNTQAVVDLATTAITAAQADLVEVADLTAYNAAKAAVVEADYTTVSWDAYELVLAANVVTAQDTQAKVDLATAKILVAQADLAAL